MNQITFNITRIFTRKRPIYQLPAQIGRPVPPANRNSGLYGLTRIHPPTL